MVGDDTNQIAAEVQRLSEDYQIVFTAGGIGPTPDDVTLSGIAQAFNTTLSNHPQIESRLKSYFGDDITPAHLKMSQAPINETELLDLLDDQGKPTPFPVLKCRNVFVLPGIPDLLKKKWRAVVT